MKLLAFIAIVAMFVIGPVNAAKYYKAGESSQYFGADKMLSLCEGSEPNSRDFCHFYLAGISDTHSTLKGWDLLPGKLYCKPKEVKTKQLRKIFIKFANEHPEVLHLNATGMAINAFIEAFPCEESSATTIQKSSKRIRSADEIERVFQKNNGSIFNLYNRALRKNPSLAGQVVIELKISPDGQVTAAKVLSSELGDETLEQKLIAKIKRFKFTNEDVQEITITYPIDFLPS
jgi:TonB family protein